MFHSHMNEKYGGNSGDVGADVGLERFGCAYVRDSTWLASDLGSVR